MTSRGRLIASCLAVLAACLLLLGCGSSNDSTGADIDPQIATDLTGQLERIKAFFQEGNCDRAIGAVDTLREALDAVAGRTGEQFTTDAQKLADNLGKQIEEECVPAVPTTPTTTDTIPTDTTDTTPTTTATTTSTTTDTTKSTTTTTTTTTEPTTEPPGGGGNGGGLTPRRGRMADPDGAPEERSKPEEPEERDVKERRR